MNTLLSLEWTIALIVVGVIILVIGTLIIINQVNKNKFNEERKEKNLEIVAALGGYFIANSQPNYPMYYSPYYMPYGTYQNPIPYSNGYYPY